MRNLRRKRGVIFRTATAGQKFKTAGTRHTSSCMHIRANHLRLTEQVATHRRNTIHMPKTRRCRVLAVRNASANQQRTCGYAAQLEIAAGKRVCTQAPCPYYSDVTLKDDRSNMHKHSMRSSTTCISLPRNIPTAEPTRNRRAISIAKWQKRLLQFCNKQQHRSTWTQQCRTCKNATLRLRTRRAMIKQQHEQLIVENSSQKQEQHAHICRL